MSSPIPDFSNVSLDIPAGQNTGSDKQAAPVWQTPEQIDLEAAADPSDLEDLDFLQTWPGIAPNLRGPYPTMYVNKPWTVRQYAGFFHGGRK